MMKMALVLAAAVSLVAAGIALAAPPLQTFGTGDVTVHADRSVTIVNDGGEYGGVYVKAASMTNKRLDQVDFSFVSSGDVAGGAPRFSIPIDTDGDTKTTEAYAFLDVNNCGGPNVSSENPSCMVFFDTAYANWDAFAAAHPDYRVSRAIPFVISDQPGTYEVSEIDLH